MQAVVQIGGKQHLVQSGSIIRVATIAKAVGEMVDVPSLITEDKGTVNVAPAKSIKVTILNHGLGEKIRIFKHHAKKRYRRTQGHRQGYTTVRIEEIGK